MQTPNGDYGFTASSGAGASTPGINALFGPVISNACSLDDLRGGFDYAYVGAGSGVYAGGGSYEVGHNDSGRKIWVVNPGWSSSIGPLPGSGGIGRNNTWAGGSE